MLFDSSRPQVGFFKHKQDLQGRMTEAPLQDFAPLTHRQVTHQYMTILFLTFPLACTVERYERQ